MVFSPTILLPQQLVHNDSHSKGWRCNKCSLIFKEHLDRPFNVFAYIFEGILNIVNCSRRRCGLAPYIMCMIGEVTKKKFENEVHQSLSPRIGLRFVTQLLLRIHLHKVHRMVFHLSPFMAVKVIKVHLSNHRGAQVNLSDLQEHNSEGSKGEYCWKEDGLPPKVD